MKLSMFNTSNPANVTEAHTILIGSSYSAALYNHKAILVNEAKDIIAFPSDTGYAVYGYDAKKGFYLRANIKLNDYWWYGDDRGLYIDDSFYVVSASSVTVIDMTTFTLLKTVKY